MKQITFVTAFIVTHILCMFLQIHKHGKYIELNYKKQHFQKRISHLQERKQELEQQLCELQSRATIMKFAKKRRMRKIRLNQIHKLPCA